MEHAPHCHAAGAILRRAVALIDASIAENLADACWTQDALESARLQKRGPGKRRHDEAFKDAVVERAVREKRARSEGLYLQSLGEEGGLGFQWSEVSLLRYQAACWLSATHLQVASVALDASRLGSPAEDVVCFAAWCETDSRSFGCWLPPQALLVERGDPGL